MIHMLPRPAVIAHRGASAHAPENTLPAFLLAVEQGAHAIELDAKLTRDGHVVVIHDQTVYRTTGETGTVREMTLAALRRLDAGSHFDVAFRYERIPTLEEVLTVLGHRTFINIELTNYASPADALPEKAAELVARFGLADRVFFSSFNPLALIRVRRRLPETPIALLALPGLPGSLARSRLGRLLKYQALHPALPDVNPALVATAHKYKSRLHVYTVNRSADMRRLYQMGVDGIFTDDPLLARQVLAIASRSGQAG